MIPELQILEADTSKLTSRDPRNRNLVERLGTWYISARFVRKRYFRSTGFQVGEPGTAAARDALKGARQFRDNFLKALRDGRVKDLAGSMMKEPEASATLDEIASLYMTAVSVIGRPGVRTAKANVSALKRIVADVNCCDPEAVGRMSSDVLTPELLEAYAIQKIRPVNGDRAAADSVRRSVRSYMRQARSLFKPAVMRHYRALKLPNLMEFLRVSVCEDPPVQRQDYTPTELDILEKRGAELKGKNDGLYMVWLLGFHLGLRAGEMVSARWSWFITENGIREIHVCDRPAEGFWCKGFSGWVPVHDDVWAELVSLKRAGDEYLLPGGSETARHDVVNREFAGWMRAMGWTRRHCAHELRAYRGDKWRKADGYGDTVAQDWLRHASIETQRHYVTRHTIKPAIL